MLAVKIMTVVLTGLLFVAVCRLLVGGGFSLFRGTGSRHTGSVVVAPKIAKHLCSQVSYALLGCMPYVG